MRVVTGDDCLLFDVEDAVRLLERQVLNSSELELLKNHSLDELESLFRRFFREELSAIADDPAKFLSKYKDDIDHHINGPDEF